jgi:hypothetical protein
MWHLCGETSDLIILVGKSDGKRPLERPERRWDDNSKMNLKRNVTWQWTGLVWLRIGIGGRLS